MTCPCGEFVLSVHHLRALSCVLPLLVTGPRKNADIWDNAQIIHRYFAKVGKCQMVQLGWSKARFIRSAKLSISSAFAYFSILLKFVYAMLKYLLYK